MPTDHKEVTMFRHACRVAVLAATLGATLVLAGNALATPTRPIISSPTATSVLEGSLTVTWTRSTFGDPGSHVADMYRLRQSEVLDDGSETNVSYHPTLDPATSTTITVSADVRYRICVEAVEVFFDRAALSSVAPGNPADCRDGTAFRTPQQVWDYDYPFREIKLPPPDCWCWETHPGFEGKQPDPKTLAAIAAAKYQDMKIVGATEYPSGEVKQVLEF